MQPCQQISLGKDAARFANEQLGQGNALAREVLTASLPFERFYTLMPSAEAAGDLLDFASGGKFSSGERHRVGSVMPIANMDEALCQVIQRYVAESPRRAVVIENPLSEPGDADLEGVSHLLVHLNEVYHLVAQPFTSRQEILGALRDAKSTVDIRGFMTVLPESIDAALTTNSLSLVEVTQLARATVGVFLGVYDGESYLVCEFSGQPDEGHTMNRRPFV